jgi:hypothetical protein
LVRGILALALALGSIGAVTAAAMGHGTDAHPHGKAAISTHWMY